MVRNKKIILRILMVQIFTVLVLFSREPLESEMELNAKIMEKLSNGKVIVRVQRLPESRTYKCLAMGMVAAPIKKVWQVLSDYNRFNEFMPKTPVAFLVRPEYISRIENRPVNDWLKFEKELEQQTTADFSQNPFYFYNRFNMPWPLRDRYFVVKMFREPEIYFVHWYQIIGNMKVNKGSWKLTPFKGNKHKTLAVYILYSDPGISIPPFLIRIATKGSLPGIIKAVRKWTLKMALEEDKNAWFKPVDIH
jgi:hypothetical protein